MRQIFNDPMKHICIVSSKIEFDKLLIDAQKRSFLKRSIIINTDIELTNADLEELIAILKNNPKAKARFVNLAICENPLITQLPDLSEFKIRILYIRSCGLTEAPDFSGFTDLQNLQIQSCEITTAPDLTHNEKLEIINLSGCPIQTTPDFINNTQLTELHLVKCGLTVAPSVAHCFKLRVYNLNENSIKEVSSFNANQNLQEIRLSDNCLEEPPEISECKKLLMLGLDRNRLRRLPSKFPDSLKYLHAANNFIEQAPVISNCRLLETLWLRDNRLLDVSDLSNCQKLKHLSFSGNPLTLISKIYLMHHMPKGSIALPFDDSGKWYNDAGLASVYSDYKLLATEFKKIRSNLYSQSNFEQYKNLYANVIYQILLTTATYKSLEPGLLRKILEYCVVLPNQWSDYNIQLLREAFATKLPLQDIIDKYLQYNQATDKAMQNAIITPLTKVTSTSVLVQFNRSKQANSGSHNLPKPENDTYNRITASKCVIS